ncbi:hypothetical protein O6H91_14G019800 [Diphasiastrum complanatum]|uniref:Uncharacterized protein n=4 Tax=Diphasiastrum complanatum TaxID=34168 RepID=A0ACC2BM08_DIPCM|nr:hypothetical protein O6H91_14G019800 [Diphasiastrum complanatum]KAJ7530802.1 hypothetical protein O6H91_14G019800 [Diphasiastrum complanatum]KAJ7530803.1 hypothetical protein O6H91_14G019800 [Diphasiastrum complanatum]KAJ7530804.1 hypothetical protein O6H91_14G019800 [Diphasiastrum complanatum]
MATTTVPTSSSSVVIPQHLYPAEEDLIYEEEILRNPFSLKLWWRYIQARRDAAFKKRAILYERAVKALPGSYKIWHAYLNEKMEGVRGLPLSHSHYESLNNTFERALVTMHKMPRIWIMYLQLLTEQKLLSRTRRTFDRALCSLPVTQHDRIWEPYLKFVSQNGVPIETSLRVYRRYLKFDPNHIENFIDFLVDAELWQEAAERLAQVLNDEDFQSLKGKTRHQLWLELCNLLTKHASDVSGLNVDAIIRGGIRHFTDEVGRLWTSLADYYIRRGLFEKARDIYEEGLTSVITVRDFSMIFDAYSQFEESMLAARMESMDSSDDEVEESTEATGSRVSQLSPEKVSNHHVAKEDGYADSKCETLKEDGDGDSKDDALKKSEAKQKSFANWEVDFFSDFWLNDEYDIDLRLARLEYLMERRPELVSSVLLRQNPHNVHEWHKRVKLFQDNPARQIFTYTEAVKTVDPFKAVGKPHTLWVAFAHLYESNNAISSAREIFEKAVQVNYKTVDDLASVWCAWAEMEMKHKNFKGALELMRRATTEPSVAVKRKVAADGDEPVQMRLFKSLRLWSMHVDLEEGLGTLESTRKVYERILDLKIATPQIVINYALMLEESRYFEDAFKVYERGVQIFKYPHVREIWTTYLSKFVKRYGGKKLERARDLFEQAVEKVPVEDAKPLFLQYAKLEEDFGLARRAMEVYDRATKSVADNEKMSIYEIYIARAAEFYGVPKTRDIYEQAIESGLPDKDVKTMCLKYAELERSLGEIDRARAIYVHASQMADPRSDAEFWSKWNEFEVQHGNEDTFREMLRIKRSVSASYSQMHFILPEYLMQRDQGKMSLEETVDTMKRAGVPEDEMAALERQIAPASHPIAPGMRSVGFVSGGIQAQRESGQSFESPVKHLTTNPDEIELEEESEDEEPQVQQKAVPDAVYGDLAEKAREIAQRDKQNAEDQLGQDKEVALGALERIKRQRRQ